MFQHLGFTSFICILLSVASINHLYLSTTAIGLLSLSFLSTKVGAARAIKNSSNFSLSLTLLFFSLLIHVYMCYSYGFANNTSIAPLVLFSCAMYVIGFYINYSKLPYYPYNTIFFILSFVFGSVVFAFASVQINKLEIGFLNQVEVINRRVNSIWSGELLTGTVYDSYSSLGFVLPTVFFFPWDRNIKKSIYFLLIVFCLVTFLMSLKAVVVLQGRNPWIALAFSSVFLLSLLLKDSKGKEFMLLLLTAIIFSVLFLDLNDIFARTGFFKGFVERSTSSSRYEAWSVVLQNLFIHLDGGRSFRIPESAAHNIILDLFYDSGWVPVILFVSFLSLQVKNTLILIQSKILPKIIQLFFGIVSIVYFVRFMSEPILKSGNLSFFFVTSCFFMGMSTRLASEIKLNTYILNRRKIQSLVT
jgi:hypothetical protein